MLFFMTLRRQTKCLLALVCLVLGSAHSAAAVILPLGEETKTMNLGAVFDYAEDKQGDLDLSFMVSRAGEGFWKKNEKKALTFGYTDSVYWVKGDLVNLEEKKLSFLLEVAYPVIDHITVYVLRSNRSDEQVMGDKFPFFNRPITHRNFLYPLELGPKERVTLVLRVKTTSSMQIPLYIHNPRYFMENDQSVMLGLGLYYGSMVIMILYNLFVFFSVREANYLNYVIYVSFMAIFLTSLNGTSYHYLWPESTWWNDQVLVVSLNGVVFFAILFTVGFLKVKEARPKSYRVFFAMAVLSVVITALSFKLPYKTGILSTIALAVVSIIWCMVVTIQRWVEGYSSARFYALAWFAMLAGGIILALNKIGFIPRSALTEYATQYGSVLEVVLLSFALADRLNIEKKERIEAQNQAHLLERNARIANEKALLNERNAREAREQALDVERKAKETLEQKVEERTHELNETLEVVKEANSQILSSLRYARMIQLAMLPQPERVSEYFSRHYIWWQPRDIVGGDFYYIDAIEPGHIVAVADCTGHGVPGAFMTLIASSELKRIVRGDGCHDPGEILTRMNRRIRKTLKQDTSTAISDDGLDIGICVIRREENVLAFSGARLNLVYALGDAMHTVHGDKNSVGYVSSSADYVYPSHLLPYSESMTFYMSTDGIIDQLGQEKPRRFGTRRLMETLMENRGQSLDSQFERLKSALEQYRGDRDQMDDMTMVAFGGSR